MSKRMIVPVLFGLVGMAILLKLSLWQSQRMVWKEAMLARIDAEIHAVPVSLDSIDDPRAAQFRAVSVSGYFSTEEVHVLASTRDVGAIYRVISAFDMDGGRRILVDRGYVLARNKRQPALIAPVQAKIVGNIRFPDEVDSSTPPPDHAKNIWFARDVPAMAKALGTEEILVIARQTTEDNPSITPLPLDRAGIPNNHLNYAITWFLLALAWLGMTLYWLWRIRRQNV